MKPILIITKNRIFGNRGIAWFWPFIFVWDHPIPHEKVRVIRNETVHFWQFIECWLLMCGFWAATAYALDNIWIMALSYTSFWIVYGLLWVVTKFLGGNGYIDHPMEEDSREWDTVDFERRPKFNWAR
jgi:hypothetical protein